MPCLSFTVGARWSGSGVSSTVLRSSSNLLCNCFNCQDSRGGPETHAIVTKGLAIYPARQLRGDFANKMPVHVPNIKIQAQSTYRLHCSPFLGFIS